MPLRSIEIDQFIPNIYIYITFLIQREAVMGTKINCLCCFWNPFCVAKSVLLPLSFLFISVSVQSAPGHSTDYCKTTVKEKMKDSTLTSFLCSLFVHSCTKISAEMHYHNIQPPKISNIVWVFFQFCYPCYQKCRACSLSRGLVEQRLFSSSSSEQIENHRITES